MTDAHTTTTFGGIDDHAEADVPIWYRDHVGATRSASFGSFHEALLDLRERFGCETRPAGFENDETGEWVEDGRFRALVNPAWLDGSGPQATALWHIVTESYEPTDHMDAFGPLVAVARKNDLTEPFGTVRTYRNGGEVQIDILFDGLRASVPDADGEPIILGFSLGQDYFGSQSIYASVIAVDERTGTVMRGLTDRFSTPHSNQNAAEDVAEWLEDMFDRAERVGETLYEVVAEAREYEVELDSIPLSVAEFYEALGFPSGMSERAAEQVRDPSRPSAYDLYLPIAQALTETYDGKKSGSALTRHATNANDLLFSPPSAERAALESAAEDLQGQGTLGAEYSDAAEALQDRIEDLDEAVSAFESVRDRIRSMLRETDETDEQDGQSADDEDEQAEPAEVDA